LRPAAEQKQRNREALAKLMKAIDASYSYRDLRVKDWRKLEKQHSAAILAARTERGFAVAAAQMLAPAGDLHLTLELDGRVFGTASRAVDPLFRRELLAQHLEVAQAGPHALAGRTSDGLGYLLVDTWAKELDLEPILAAIAGLRDTRALVVDARTNSGGNELLARRVAAWFVEGDKVYAKHRLRTGPGQDGFGPTEERRVQGNGPEQRYDAPIAVLTSPYVMSSNESFVMMLRQAHDCTVVGQPTFGSSGNPQPHELGNGVRAWIPSWQDLRLDGSVREGQGIAPDVLVDCSAEDLEQRDPILEKALEILRAKLR
jgi:C-terminal processing protease CtpA/Prc